jgi:hypothetical protein
MSPDLLEEILVETRPAADPAWAAEMDRRVERGFERVGGVGGPPSPSWFARHRPMLVPALGMAATFVLVVGVATLGGNGGDFDDGLVAGSSAGGEAEMDTAQSAPESSSGSDAGVSADEASRSALAAPRSGGGGAVPGDVRKVERFASLTLTAPPREIAGLGDEVIALTDRLGGYVASSTVSSSADGGGGSLELKVPAGRLERAMAELSKLAHVSDRSQAMQDITGEHNATRSQVREAKAERQSLLRQLAAATTINETASIRARLRIVANELDAARQAARRVGRRAAYATVSVTLAADADAPSAGGGWSPGDALGDAGRLLEVAAGVAIIALAAALPLALLALAAWLVVRWTVRRRRDAALDATG